MAADLPPPSYDDVLRADALLADSSAGQVPETTAVTVPHGDDVVVAMGAPNEDAHWQATSRAPDTHPQATAASAETPVADETDGAVDEGPSRYAWITAQPKKNKVKPMRAPQAADQAGGVDMRPTNYGEGSEGNEDDDSMWILFWGATRIVLSQEDVNAATKVVLVILVQPIDLALLALLVLYVLTLSFLCDGPPVRSTSQ